MSPEKTLEAKDLRAFALVVLILLSSLLQITPILTTSGQWSTPSPITTNTILHFSPSTAQDNTGTIYLFWDQNPGINYIVTNTANIANNIWPNPVLYTRNSASDYSPTVVALKNGTLVLFYASLRAGRWSIYEASYNGGQWSPEVRFTNSPAPDQGPSAIQDSLGRLWVAWSRTDSGDLKIRFVDYDGTGAWRSGEPILYDTNGNGVYDAGEPVISGVAPSTGTVTANDPRLKFIDSQPDGIWDPGEFVIYDPYLQGIYTPKIGFVDSNNNNVWDLGEPMVYDSDSNGQFTFHSGPTTDCSGTIPTQDCIIAGTPPANNTSIKIDPLIKFVDLNGDGVWQPGEALVYDANNNGLYDSGEQAVEALTSDPKLSFIGPGSTWAPGNAVFYDSNGNLKYDSSIKFVDTNANGHWDPGETVVNDNNLNSFYDITDNVIFEAQPPAHDLNKFLKNDPSLKFVDANGNGRWDLGEAVCYDSNLNSIYDGKVKFVDSNGNGHWDTGEAAVYDTDNNAVYTTGRFHNDTLIGGPTPANNTALRTDPLIKFYDKNGNTGYDLGETVVYDSNNNGLYDSEPIISGQTPAPLTGITAGLGEPVVSKAYPNTGTILKTDPKAKFVDNSPYNGAWDPPSDSGPGEDIIYDVNNTGTYRSGDPILFSNGTLPAPGAGLSSDSHIKYTDSNSNNKWDSNEAVVYDGLSHGTFDFTVFVIAGIIPAPNTLLTNSSGEPVISGLTPTGGSSLKSDLKLKVLDLNGNSHWDNGEPVVYDSNGNGLYDGGEPQVFGTPDPTPGTALKMDENVLYGITISNSSPLSLDGKIRYLDSNLNGHWDPGETLVYDSDNNILYTTGRFHNDTIITGAAPANRTQLASDSKLKFVNQNGNGSWDTGESVVYDSNNNNIYDTGESIVRVFSVPASSATLRADSLVKYADFNSNGKWDPGEPVAYDKNNNGAYEANEWTISGTPPKPGTLLVSDSHIKILDSSGDGKWELGEDVVYDTNGDNLYQQAEPIIASGGPLPGTQMRVVPHVFYRTYNGAWGPEQRLTSLPNTDNVPTMGQTRDGRVWIVWSGERGGPNEILYRTTSDGNTWTPETVLASSSLGDTDPAIIQDRNGTIWIVWARQLSCSCGGGINLQSDLYSVTSTSNGASWNSAVDLTPTGSGPDELEPNLAQFNDKKLYIFFPVEDFSGSSATVNLSYMSNPILMHDSRMNGASSSTVNLRATQTLGSTANVTNIGDYNDTLTLTVVANNTVVATNSSLVLSGQTVRMVVNWVVRVSPGKYIITLVVSAPGESLANKIDNAATIPGVLQVRPAGDVNGDCTVNIVDLVIVAASFGKSVGSPGYNPVADVNGDGRVDIADLSIVGSGFGQTC